MQKIYFVFVFLIAATSSTGQKLWQKQGLAPVVPVCYASDKVERVFIPPPAEVLSMLKSAEKKSDIIVSYSLFPKNAQDAFDYAVSIWESIIESPVPIYIQANWRSLGQNVLGSCGPSDFKKNFNGAPRKNIYYPVVLVEKLTGNELTGPELPDMKAEFNKDINWYFGTDGNTPSLLYDFVSVVLHEIGHGLGFTGFFYVESQTGGYDWNDMGEATSFDRLVENSSGNQLINASVFGNPSTALKNTLTSGLLYANSAVAITNEKTKPRLYAPSIWDDGSSIYHLNDATYGSGTNALMTHALGRGEAIHDPGPLTMGILADLGWKNMQIGFNPPKDLEIVKPVRFSTIINSDFELDTNRIYVVFSTDSFTVHTDSLALIPNEINIFEAEWIPDPGTKTIYYYISASDVKNRVFTIPSEAPDEYLKINIGPDIILPQIDHEPIPYFFDTGGFLIFTANVDDNLGIDTVFVEYSINGMEQPPFGLKYDSATVYSASFPVENNMLNDRDEIVYNIVAVDASMEKNTRKIPVEEKFSFKVEKKYDPIGGYINNFDNPTTDFILTDFQVFQEKKFDNGALHSPHPYPSPDQDDTEFNFSTILKYPIILNEDAVMSFDEIVLVEPGDAGTQFGDFGFWDYVIVEGSKNNGETWLPLTDGYDSRANTTWKDGYNKFIRENNSVTTGTPDYFISREIDMLENGNFSAGDTILIRFRLFSDPYAHGWGWAIDNLQIQTPVSAPQPILSPGNLLVYPNPFEGKFYVLTDAKQPVEELQLDVFNMYGQKVKSVIHHHVAGSVTSEITIENGISGIYFLVVRENGKQVFTKKLIHN